MKTRIKLYNGLKISQILTQNSKLKKTSKENNKRVFNFGITAYKTSTGKIVCPFAKDCIKFCYAKKGAYNFGNVKPLFEQRYNLTKSEIFIEAINDSIKAKKVDILRIHDSGDFYSNEYINKWITIAKENKNVIFYAYTKSIPLFEKINLPKNFIIIYSYGSKVDNLIDVSKHRHSKIFDDEEQLIKEGYINASKNDLNAIRSNKKVGLIFH
jgi:hypothetical protein